MSTERTLPQSDEGLRRAQLKSLERTQPPLQIPGYDIERFLGAGAYGEVWVAVDRNTGRRVAIKYYTHRGGLDWSLLSREVEKLAFLFADRYVVQLIDVGWEADPPYYIMEYVVQGSLADKLKQGPLSVAASIELFREVAIGLVHAHDKGVLHCDLKPANVLLDQDGKPRLADFGQSRLSHEQTPALGTLFYMAPEQADLKAVPDARWDVYALGALLYCMLTDEPPYRDLPSAASIHQVDGLDEMLSRYRDLIRNSPPPRAHRRVPGVDRDLAEIVERCLAVDPRKRFANPQTVVQALAARTARRARRPLLVLGAIGPAVLLAVMALLGVTTVRMAVRDSSQTVTSRAQESNHFAAALAGSEVARMIDRRWSILSAEAADPDFRALLIAATGRARGDPARDRLQSRVEELDRKYAQKGINTSSWVVMDAVGTQLARSPFSATTIDQNYAFRDYFHGEGRNLNKGDRRPPFKREAHLSIVFKSEANDERKVAFSVPIRDGKSGSSNPEIIGVLSITVGLGEFTELPTGSQQKVVLVDSKDDSDRNPGAILEHPRLKQERGADEMCPDFYMDQRRLDLLRLLWEWKTKGRARSEQETPPPEWVTWDDYQDPVGGDYEGRWLAAVEPVMVKERPANVRNTGWVVIVQERYDAIAAPVVQLGDRMYQRGVMALGAVLAIVTALWGFVMIVLNESPRWRFLARFRRRAGLTQPSSAAISSRDTSDLPSSLPISETGQPTGQQTGQQSGQPTGQPSVQPTAANRQADHADTGAPQ